MRQTVRLATYAMGTRFELVVSHEHETAARAAGEEALRLIEECHQRFSVFERDSLISHINRIAHRQAVRLDADTFEMFRICKAVHAESGGAFDVTVGPIMEALGFRGGRKETFDTAASEIGSEWIELDEDDRTIRFAEGRRLRLDLGGVAKGHGLDMARQSLVANGIDSALLHGGTSGVITIGQPVASSAAAASDGWPVAVRPPTGSAVSAGDYPSVVLRDAALSVSARHGRVVNGADGNVIGHVVDPRKDGSTWGKCEGVLLSVVIGDSACAADAWSTALLVAGDEDVCREGFVKSGMAGIVCTNGTEGRLQWEALGCTAGAWSGCMKIPWGGEVTHIQCNERE